MRIGARVFWSVNIVLWLIRGGSCYISVYIEREDIRGIVASRAEHDRHVREKEPRLVVGSEVVDKRPHKRVVRAGHHEANREACGMSSRGDKVEASQGSQTALTREIQVQHDA